MVGGELQSPGTSKTFHVRYSGVRLSVKVNFKSICSPVIDGQTVAALDNAQPLVLFPDDFTDGTTFDAKLRRYVLVRDVGDFESVFADLLLLTAAEIAPLSCGQRRRRRGEFQT